MFKIVIVIILFIMTSCNKSSEKEIKFHNNYKFSEEIENDISDNNVGANQYRSWEYAFQGNYKIAKKEFNIDFINNSHNYESILSINLKKYTVQDAIEYITIAAKKHQFVIINEAHHNPRHRNFIKKLLPNLRKSEFSVLGIEDLHNDKNKDYNLNTRKYPKIESGFYIKDPQFGNMVREALNLGFYVFPYDVKGDIDPKKREIIEAENINEIFKLKSDEKFIIYCGFGHVMEGDFPGLGKVMAGRLKSLTDSDPLTIIQNVYSEELVSEHLKINKINPFVLVDINGKALGYKRGESYADIAIFNPKTEYYRNRPSWLFDENFKKVEVSLDNNLRYPIMVLAYKKDEDYTTAIPIDVVEIKSNKDGCVLSLKKGEYNIIQTDNQKTTLTNIKVE